MKALCSGQNMLFYCPVWAYITFILLIYNVHIVHYVYLHKVYRKLTSDLWCIYYGCWLWIPICWHCM